MRFCEGFLYKDRQRSVSLNDLQGTLRDIFNKNFKKCTKSNQNSTPSIHSTIFKCHTCHMYVKNLKKNLCVNMRNLYLVIGSQPTSSLVIINQELKTITFVKTTFICDGICQYKCFSPSYVCLEIDAISFLQNYVKLINVLREHKNLKETIRKKNNFLFCFFFSI